jgi:hypothetical protein
MFRNAGERNVVRRRLGNIIDVILYKMAHEVRRYSAHEK